MMTDSVKPDVLDPPRRIRDVDIADRYGISERKAGDWLRLMVGAGALAKIGGVTMGRWSACDAWVLGGGKVPRGGRAR